MPIRDAEEMLTALHNDQANLAWKDGGSSLTIDEYPAAKVRGADAATYPLDWVWMVCDVTKHQHEPAGESAHAGFILVEGR
jgi:hypothetical protein